MNITEYIKNHNKLSQMDFETVYYTIFSLIQDGYILEKLD